MLSWLAKLLSIRVVRLDDIAAFELSTARLRLRSFRPFDDWPRYREYHRDPEVVRHLAPRPESDEHLRATLKAHVAVAHFGRGHLHLGIQLAGDSRLLGEVHVVPDAARRDRAFLGFLLHRDAWGRGIGTEAARAIVEHAMQRVGYREVWAGCTRGNDRSQRVLEKIGMQRTDERVVFPGEPEGADVLAYKMVSAT